MDICQKVKHQPAQNQTKPSDNVQNNHAQLSQVFHSFRTSKTRLRRVTLPMVPTGATIVDIVPCM